MKVFIVLSILALSAWCAMAQDAESRKSDDGEDVRQVAKRSYGYGYDDDKHGYGHYQKKEKVIHKYVHVPKYIPVVKYKTKIVKVPVTKTIVKPVIKTIEKPVYITKTKIVKIPVPVKEEYKHDDYGHHGYGHDSYGHDSIGYGHDSGMEYGHGGHY